MVAIRTNDDWLLALRASSEVSESARRELRSFLVRSLRRMLASRRVSDDLCEDFTHDALLRIDSNLNAFRGESQFTTWALSIATRVAFDELRRKRWRDVSFESVTQGATEPVTFEQREEAGPDRKLAREQVLSLLAKAIEGELTERQRQVLSAELAGVPHLEIARHLQMNRNALYKLAHDARKRIRLRLEREGVTLSDVAWVFA